MANSPEKFKSRRMNPTKKIFLFLSNAKLMRKSDISAISLVKIQGNRIKIQGTHVCGC